MDIQENYNERTRRIGKDYWHKQAIVTRVNNSEKVGSYSSENCSELVKRRLPKQDKSDHECFASYTFKSFNKDTISAYEIRHPQPKEWRGKS